MGLTCTSVTVMLGGSLHKTSVTPQEDFITLLLVTTMFSLPDRKKLTGSEFANTIQHMTNVIRNQQLKQCYVVPTLAHLLLDYTRKRQGLTLYLDKHLTQL